MTQMMEDSYVHKGARRILIQELREKGIKDENVLEAMMNVPRHFFLDSAFDKIAYSNMAFPIGEGQTISHPFTVAFQTELLQVQKGDKILEIGTGSCYQACILAEMGAKVYTIERQKKLFQQVEKFAFRKKYFNLHRSYGDGFKGLPMIAPFDKIIITAGAPFLPDTLVEQLKNGGRIVIPINTDNPNEQLMTLFVKNEDGNLSKQEFNTFEFVPMLPGRNR